MLPATTLNYLVWENTKNLPFPKEMQDLVDKTDWTTYEWSTCNLPVDGAKYDVSDGKTLYLAQLPDGAIKTEKQEYTGDIPIATYIVNPDKDGYNWFVSFNITFVKGEVVDIQLDRYKKHDAKEYNKAQAEMAEKVNKRLKKYNSWWYKWLYRPWVFLVKCVVFITTGILKVLIYLIIRLGRLIALVDFIG